MSKLIPIQYHSRDYPFGITPQIREVAGHFDVVEAGTNSPSSLHTEYSYGKRKLSSVLIERFPTIRASQRNNIPQLWTSRKWAKEFVEFIINVTTKPANLKIIEIHPPFNDYCESLNEFIEIYKEFEDRILSILPEVEIFIENRSGTMYRGGRFLLSKNTEVLTLSEIIYKTHAKLRIVLDLPQLFTAHLKSMDFNENDIISVLKPLKECNRYIKGMHVWGKKQNQSGRRNAHIGDFDSYFGYDISKKQCFLRELYDLFNDGNHRYFVPEVNSGDGDVKSIVSDIIDTGFEFV